SNTAVNWSIVSGGGSIDSGVYRAPSPIISETPVIVKATSVFDPNKSDTATVMLEPPVSVSPGSVTLVANQTQQFTANQAVNWSITSNPGTFTPALDGRSALYTAPATINSQS